jgi:8-oxo-dGTP pyrophosphatase MutT (NUDIX family)
MSDSTFQWPEGMTEEQRSRVLGCKKFREFVARASAGFDFRGGRIRDVKWFGPRQDVVGFVLFDADALTPDGRKFPGTTAFIRGDSSAVLVVLVTPDGAEWTPVIRQPRIPVGDARYEEILAGMVDEGGFHSAALRELEEEVGGDLGIGPDDLRFMRTYHTSPGGSDEAVSLYYARKEVGYELVRSLNGREGGLASEGERIEIEMIPLDDLSFRAGHDGKAALSYFSYMALVGRVARPFPVEGDLPADGPSSVRSP